MYYTIAQAAEGLPYILEALGSILSTVETACCHMPVIVALSCYFIHVFTKPLDHCLISATCSFPHREGWREHWSGNMSRR